MDGDQGIPQEYYFITPPQNVSWSKDSNTTPIDTYGTNNPYLQYGTTKLRSLTLGDSLVEGFSDGKSVEGNVRDLEACMRMVIDSDNGFASPFCWEVFAAGKKYGTYVITSVNVDERMRDNSGDAVRAKVDVSLQEVSPYQVSTGEDISSQAISGGFSEEYEKKINDGNAGKQDDKVADKKPKGDYKVGDYEYDAKTGKPVSGPGIDSSKTDASFDGSQAWGG